MFNCRICRHAIIYSHRICQWYRTILIWTKLFVKLDYGDAGLYLAIHVAFWVANFEHSAHLCDVIVHIGWNRVSQLYRSQCFTFLRASPKQILQLIVAHNFNRHLLILFVLGEDETNLVFKRGGSHFLKALVADKWSQGDCGQFVASFHLDYILFW